MFGVLWIKIKWYKFYLVVFIIVFFYMLVIIQINIWKKGGDQSSKEFCLSVFLFDLE